MDFVILILNSIFQGQQNFNKHVKLTHGVDPSTVQAIVVEEEEEEDSSQSSQVSGSVTSLGLNDQVVMCALCPETFACNELLQKHTTTHFNGSNSDEMLREKLLRQTMKRTKKKKRAKLAAAQGGVPTTSSMELVSPSKSKFKKSYSCLLCNMTFSKKTSWRIHKIRHAGKGWKCEFCSDLHEDSSALSDHLLQVHKMDSDEMLDIGILKTANMFVVTKKRKEERKVTESSSEETDSEDNEDYDEEVICNLLGSRTAGVHYSNIFFRKLFIIRIIVDRIFE
jgi:hypothetical protein